MVHLSLLGPSFFELLYQSEPKSAFVLCRVCVFLFVSACLSIPVNVSVNV